MINIISAVSVLLAMLLCDLQDLSRINDDYKNISEIIKIFSLRGSTKLQSFTNEARFIEHEFKIISFHSFVVSGMFG